MKKYVVIILSAALALTLSACKKEPQPASAQSVPSSSSSQSASKAVSSSKADSSSSSSSSSSEASSVSPKGMTEVSVPISTDKGANGTLTLSVPEDWEFNGHTVMSSKDIKTMEVVNAITVTDTANPISDTATYGFGASDEMTYPDGYGNIDTFEGVAGGNDYKMFVYKIFADSGEVWYPHYTFIHMGDYILQVHFYPFEQTDEMSTYIDIMKTMKLEF